MIIISELILGGKWNTDMNNRRASTKTIVCVIGRCVAEELAFQRRNHNARLKNVKVSTYCSTFKGHVGFFISNHAGPIS